VTLLRRSAAGLAAEMQGGESVIEHMLEQVIYQMGHRPSASEVASWKRSIPVLAGDLVEAGLGDVEMLVEHHLPLTSQRADVVLAGAHPRTGEPSYVISELKQWSEAHRWEGDPDLVEVPGAPGSPRTHPVKQVRGYCDYLLDFARALQDQPDAVAGAAYLHNAVQPERVEDLFQYPMDVRGRLFTGATRGQFLEFLQQRLAPGIGGAPFADALINSKVAPSVQLLKVAADEVQSREQFTLIGDQVLAVDLVLHEVRNAHRADRKRAVIVTGGPGSGKSVIALSLLGELAREGRTVLHATGSRSFTQTLRRVAGYREPRVQKMFKYFNQFMTAEKNSLDVLILDEAHRIRDTSVDRYTPAAFRSGRPQIDELIAAARVPVFLLDENQVVRPGELGSVTQITAFCRSLGIETHVVELGSQFRCGGSEEYVQWVHRLLGLSNLGPATWDGDPQFTVAVADSPEQMEAFLATRQEEGFGARIAAGYCWPWSDPRPDGTLVPDVKIGSWARPWNVKGDRRVGDAPPAPLWSIEDGGFGQVGCVYTAQGFEYDWSGVILGPDLVWREGRMVSDRSANKDPDFRNTKRVSDADFDRLVRNVYKVLLTRGMIGTVLYSTDPDTQARLKHLVGTSVYGLDVGEMGKGRA
jgi:hypothetical protein